MDFKITAIKEGIVGIRSNAGSIVLRMSGTAQVNEAFVKQCSIAIKALIEANVISLNKLVAKPTVAQVANGKKPPVVRTNLPKQTEDEKSVFPGKSSKAKTKEEKSRQRISK